ncbi:MAG: hypothetical protein JNK79_08920 [Chitinophagaceae bacterium]|nr:hypothetical protein [Chitinophagaceae bacterium]
MIKLVFFFGFLITMLSHEQQETAPPEKEGIHFFVDPATNSDDPEKRMAYGLNVTPPWRDGGSFFINLPEHLWYMPDTKGIARHHDKRKNVWKVSADGKEAGYSAESLTQPGVFLDVKAVATADRVHFEMTLTNKSDVFLESISPLFCYQYHHLKGFPLKQTDNFAHTFIVMNGKPVALKDIQVKNPGAVARMAQVKDCKIESNWWAEEMGGMIEQRMDMSLTALTSSSDDRKVILSWTPGKSILSNTVIPCIHADACIGDLAKGESKTIRGTLLFTRDPLEMAIKKMIEDTGNTAHRGN